MPTNYEWLLHMDGEERQAWFDAEHVDNARSAKRAAAVERLRGMTLNTGSAIKKLAIALDVRWNPDNAPLSMAVLQNALIELLTDDDGLRNNDGVAAEHGATRMTNLERLFVDSEQFRQAVSAFAFAHSDDCPTSPTQMVDWLMAPYVDAHSKPHSKTEQMLTEQSESLSDDLGHPTDMSQKSADCVRNDGKMSETGVSANDVDANDENATCNNSGDFVTDDSREKIEDDVCNWIHERRNHYAGNIGAIHQIYEWLNRQAEITHAETIHTYNLAAREVRKVQEERIAELQANVDELVELNDYHSLQYDLAYEDAERLQAQVDNLTDELAKRDKGIARLKRQRDTARAKIDELEAECDTCCYKTDYIEMDFYDVDRLEAERDNLARDLADCERQRERLRQALGTAIDHAHEIVSLVNLDGEVIG